MEKCQEPKKFIELQLARAYVLPQSYENLIPVDKALWKGTIFEDLKLPYYTDITDYKKDKED